MEWEQEAERDREAFRERRRDRETEAEENSGGWQALLSAGVRHGSW